ncbi:hypothetical protein [Sphingopyxis sp. R3-92]|uniref:hypothetical protein n=1 Tax=Sphingopyxis sp. R3-92 TaxID=3158553 RepID=UPI003EE791E7
MNVTLPESDVTKSCKTAGVAISAIEPLPSGGTRLVCVTLDDADKMRKRLKKNLIDGAVTRYRFYRPPSV